MSNKIIPTQSTYIHNVPKSMGQVGISSLVDRRRTLSKVNPPSSLAKTRKMSGIDPVLEDKSYRPSYKLESIMLSRMKESYCDYDIPVSHFRVIDMVHEGKVPKSVLQEQFGDIEPEELEDVLIRHTVQYQEMENDDNGFEEQFPLEDTRTRSFGGTARSSAVKSAQNPIHPSLRRIEYVPATVAVSGLPPPTPDASKQTYRNPFSSSQTKRRERLSDDKGGMNTVTARSLTATQPSTRQFQSNTANFSATTRENRIGTAGSTRRQRFGFDPNDIQKEYEGTFLTKRATRRAVSGVAEVRGRGDQDEEPDVKSRSFEGEGKQDFSATLHTQLVDPTQVVNVVQKSGEKIAEDEDIQATSHTRRPLSGFLTKVVPTTQTKKKKDFAEAAESSYGVHIAMGKTKERMIQTQQMAQYTVEREREQRDRGNKTRPTSSNMATMENDDTGGTGSRAMNSGGLVSPMKIASDVIESEQRKERKVKDRKEMALEIQQSQNGEIDEELNVLLNGEVDEDDLDEAMAGFEGNTVVDFGPQRENERRKRGGMYGRTGDGENKKKSALKKKMGTNGGKEGEEKTGDVHPHVKMSVHGITFKAAPSVLTEELARLSEGISLSLSSHKQGRR